MRPLGAVLKLFQRIVYTRNLFDENDVSEKLNFWDGQWFSPLLFLENVGNWVLFFFWNEKVKYPGEKQPTQKFWAFIQKKSVFSAIQVENFLELQFRPIHSFHSAEKINKKAKVSFFGNEKNWEKVK